MTMMTLLWILFNFFVENRIDVFALRLIIESTIKHQMTNTVLHEKRLCKIAYRDNILYIFIFFSFFSSLLLLFFQPFFSRLSIRQCPLGCVMAHKRTHTEIQLLHIINMYAFSKVRAQLRYLSLSRLTLRSACVFFLSCSFILLLVAQRCTVHSTLCCDTVWWCDHVFFLFECIHRWNTVHCT